MDALGQRMLEEKEAVAKMRREADELDRMAKQLRRNADEMERRLELARLQL